MSDHPYGAGMFPHHAEMLAASAIAPEVAEARGYRSVDNKAMLERMGFGKNQRRVPGLLVPIHGVEGGPVLLQHRPDDPRQHPDNPDKVIKYETPYGQRLRLDVPPGARGQLTDPTVPLWVTEGAKKADAAVSAGLCCIALLGVWAWRGTNEKGGKAALADWDSVALNRDVFVCFDSDVMQKREVARALDRFAAFLRGRAARVWLVYLPAGEDGAKVGLDDYLAAGHTTDELYALAVDADDVLTDGRPKVNISNGLFAGDWLRRTIGSGVLAGYLRRGDDVVYTPRENEAGYVEPKREDDDDGPAQVRIASKYHIAATINGLCRPFRLSQDEPPKEIPARFPVDIAREPTVRADLCDQLRPLRGVTHTPLVRADGSILTTPGYDPATRLLYLPDPELAVPEVPTAPTPDQVRAAVELVSTMLAEFPWVTPSDRANYIGLQLTSVLRDLVPPPYQVGVITAPQRGSGKSYLATALRILHGGVFRSEVPRDEAELKKQITSILTQTTAPVVIWDNVAGVFRSSVFDGLLTSNVWSDRVLGATQETDRPNDRLWVLTGNNVTIGGDLPRRTLWVNIDANMPHPERRTGFAIVRFEAWVREHRGELLGALLTLVAAWVAAGQPVTPAGRSDSYGRWYEVVGGILTHAGIEGTFGDPATAREGVSTDDEEWAELLTEIERIYGDQAWTTRQALTYRESEYDNTGMTTFRHPIAEALPGELAGKIRGHDPTTVTKSLGMWLKHRDGRWVDTRCVRYVGKGHKSARLWRIVRSNGDTGDTGDTNSGYVEGDSSSLESSGGDFRGAGESVSGVSSVSTASHPGGQDVTDGKGDTPSDCADCTRLRDRYGSDWRCHEHEVVSAP